MSTRFGNICLSVAALGNGVDYLPAVREIRAALDEPTGRKHVGFDCIPVLDAWLRERG